MEFATTSFGVNSILFCFGVFLLVRGSDGVVDGAAEIATHYRISDAVIGLTLVSIGTSLPELATNVYAAAIDQSVVAIGNVVGSNITNTLLVAGIGAAGMGMIATSKEMFYRDVVTMLVVFFLFSVLCYSFDGPLYQMGRVEGAVLFGLFILYLVYLLRQEKEDAHRDVAEGQGSESKEDRAIAGVVVAVLFFCVMVVVGAKLMVDNVVWAAREFEVPEELISATIIALGTSLPEVAVTVAGIVKKKNDIAMGNIVGSNTFNLLLVMSTTAMIRPVEIGAEVRGFLLPAMLIAGVVFALFLRTKWSLVRWEGIILLVGYCFFIGYNVMQV